MGAPQPLVSWLAVKGLADKSSTYSNLTQTLSFTQTKTEGQSGTATWTTFPQYDHQLHFIHLINSSV